MAIITAENEADNRVDGAVCGGHEGGKEIVWQKIAREPNGTVRYKMKYCLVSDVGDPAKKKHKHDNNGHVKHVSVSS